jgi:hypothetical protein
MFSKHNAYTLPRFLGSSWMRQSLSSSFLSLCRSHVRYVRRRDLKVLAQCACLLTRHDADPYPAWLLCRKALRQMSRSLRVQFSKLPMNSANSILMYSSSL